MQTERTWTDATQKQIHDSRYTAGEETAAPRGNGDPHAPDNSISAEWSDEHDGVVIAADDDHVPEEAQRFVREFHEAFLEDDLTPPTGVWYFFESVRDAEASYGRDIGSLRYLELDDGVRVVVTDCF